MDHTHKMDEATMLYKRGGPHELQDGRYDHIIVDAVDVQQHLEAGWFLTPAEATEAAKPKAADSSIDTAPPARTELESKARELEIKFDGRTTDAKLGALIAEKLKV